MTNRTPNLDTIAAFTDLHFGMKNNSREHNMQCEQFLLWFIEQAQKQGCKTCVFLGDWHHVRSAINISTLNYSVAGLRLLSAAFDDVFFIIGNHDLYFRDKLEIHSIPYIQEFDNIHLIDKITTVGDHTFVPWLVGDEWKKVTEISTPYIWGHFELPRFKMNAMVEMPDHGQLNGGHFRKQKYVFSGHFHKRQIQGNVHYIGNAFPHNYSDVWDDDRGMMFWQKNQEPRYQTWPQAPRYRVLSLEDLLYDPAKYLKPENHVRVQIPRDFDYLDMTFLRDVLQASWPTSELAFQTAASDEVSQLQDEEIDFQSVDTIVISHLNSIESKTIDCKKLVEIYQSL